MASRLFASHLSHFRTPLLAVGLGLSATACFKHQLNLARPIMLDSTNGISRSLSSTFSTYETQADTPVTKNGRLNPRAIRQISMGSILGLLAGVGVSVFSKSLAILLGLAIAGLQTAESYGIHLIPYKRLQSYVKGVDLRSAVQDNVAFKVSFGLIFALTGFAEFSNDP